MNNSEKFELTAFWQNVFFEAFRLKGKAEDAIKEANLAMAAHKDAMNHIDNFNPKQGELF